MGVDFSRFGKHQTEPKRPCGCFAGEHHKCEEFGLWVSGVLDEIEDKRFLCHIDNYSSPRRVDEPYLFIHGGPTAYESAPVKGLLEDYAKNPAGIWIANMGTGGYQKLEIPLKQCFEAIAKWERLAKREATDGASGRSEAL